MLRGGQSAVLSIALLQVRADCMPRKLLEYMCSEAGLAASEAAAAGERSKAQEDLLLERVREALGCRHVIRVCTNHDQSRVMEAAERLLQHAAAIRCSVDLSGGCSGCLLRSVGVCKSAPAVARAGLWGPQNSCCSMQQQMLVCLMLYRGTAASGNLYSMDLSGGASCCMKVCSLNTS